MDIKMKYKGRFVFTMMQWTKQRRYKIEAKQMIMRNRYLVSFSIFCRNLFVINDLN